MRRLFPRTMLGNQDCVSINSEGGIKGSHFNELDDTVGSSRSSFADIWDSTSIEVRAGIVYENILRLDLKVRNSL